MKLNFQILLALIVFSSCGNNKPRPDNPSRANTMPSSIDSSYGANDEKELFVERGHYEDSQ